MDAATRSWWERELAGCAFADARLGQRLRKLIEKMDGAIGASLPLVCQDWANTKAAYRFFSNDRVSEAQILAGHFQATRDRFAATDGFILVVQDTTEFTFQREHAEAIGITYRVNSGRDRAGRFRMHTVCGLLMHASLAVTIEGLPLGLSAVKFWSRQQFKGTSALKRKIHPTRVPIERKESIRWLENMRQSTELLGAPARCVHVGDRESDIYELFCTARELGTHFIVRSCVDRLAGNGSHTIANEMDEVPVQGMHSVEVRDGKGRVGSASVELRYRRVLEADHRLARPRPRGSDRKAALVRTPLEDRGLPQGPEVRLSGRGGTAADSRAPGEADRGVLHSKLAGVLDDDDQPSRAACRPWPCPHQGRDRAPGPPVVPDNAQARTSAQTLSSYLIKVARLGGYLARSRDPPPGNVVMWRGLSRLTDIVLGATLARAAPIYG
jgi:hypothetical protein